MNDDLTKSQLNNIESIKAFTTAGNARLTIRSTKTGARFTYWIKATNDKHTGPVRFFVRVLTDEHNDDYSAYTYLGCVFDDGAFVVGRKSPIGFNAPSAQAFRFFWRCLTQGSIPPALEVWHEGRCGMCGRVLTVPESIESGIGPKCAGKLAA